MKLKALVPLSGLVVALQFGCTRLEAVSSDEQWSRLVAGDHVVVVTRDERELELTISTVTPASVTGEIVRSRAAAEPQRSSPIIPVPPPGERVTLPRSDVASLEVRRVSAVKTGLVLALVAALVIGGDGPDYSVQAPR